MPRVIVQPTIAIELSKGRTIDRDTKTRVREELQLQFDALGNGPTVTGNEANSNVLQLQDYPVHSWYRFVQSYPPHLVRKYIEKFRLDRCSLREYAPRPAPCYRPMLEGSSRRESIIGAQLAPLS